MVRNLCTRLERNIENTTTLSLNKVLPLASNFVEHRYNELASFTTGQPSEQERLSCRIPHMQRGRNSGQSHFDTLKKLARHDIYHAN